MKGPYLYALDAFFQLADVVPGAQVQARFVEIDAKGKVVRSKGIGERFGTSGSTFVDFSRAAASCGTGSTVAIDLLVYNMTDTQPTPEKFRIVGGTAEYNYVPQAA
ncbi:hypothetical protein [Streptomyces sp. NPDC001999]